MEIPPEESTDLEELEQFAKMFKQKRIKLGKLKTITCHLLFYLNLLTTPKIEKNPQNCFRIHPRRCWACDGENVWK